MAVGGEVVRHVQLLVDSYLKSETDLSSGPVAVKAGSAMVNIALLDCDPARVRIFAAVVSDIPESPDLLAVLNEVNATTNFIRLFWRNDVVYAADELLAATLDLDELMVGVSLVADLSDHYDDVLIERFGGKPAITG